MILNQNVTIKVVFCDSHELTIQFDWIESFKQLCFEYKE